MSANAEALQEAYGRARHGQSLTNYPAIIRGFIAKGIPADQIIPRQNVFTYDAWKAQGRQVRKGEHGVKVLTFIACSGKEDKDTGERKAFRRPWSTTVFHITQTDPANGAA